MLTGHVAMTVSVGPWPSRPVLCTTSAISAVPAHEVLITNPPYSAEHKQRLR